MSNYSDPNELFKKLMSVKNSAQQKHFSSIPTQQVKVSIRVDESVTPSKFISNPLVPGEYRAHPITINAMRENLFVGGSDEFIDLEKIYQCDKCKNKIDLQFWKSCPHCGANI